MNTDANNRIVEFEEKPAQPKSTKASMGIYIFDWNDFLICLLLLKRAMWICQTLGRTLSQIISSLVKVSMLMNLMATGKMLVRLSHFGKPIWSTFRQRDALDSRNRQWKIYSRNLISPTKLPWSTCTR